MSHLIRTVLCLLVLASVAAGCADEELFITCPMDKSIEAICSAADGDTRLTCVVAQHPQCPDDVCLRWKGNESLCTKVCNPEGNDCPGGSTCTAYADTFYCVKNEHL